MRDQDRYDKLLEAYVRAHEAGDEDAIGQLFSEDALLLDPKHQPVSGRQAIQEAYKKWHMGDGIKLMMNVREFHVSGDLAYGAGTFKAEEGTGNYLDVLRRQNDGSFLYQVICWNWH